MEKVGVDIGWCRPESEEKKFNCTQVGKVDKFTDFTDQNAFSTLIDTDTDLAVSVGITRFGPQP
jgi:hypothetical protein